MNVSAILNGKGRSVVTVHPHDTLEQVAGQLAARRIGAVVVSDGGGVAGIISERDIVRAIARNGTASLSEPVHRHMTRDVVTCREADTLDEIMASMTAGRFRHLPVVEDGRLSGIVSIGDVVKHHIAEVEMEATALRGYIVTVG